MSSIYAICFIWWGSLNLFLKSGSYLTQQSGRKIFLLLFNRFTLYSEILLGHCNDNAQTSMHYPSHLIPIPLKHIESYFVIFEQQVYITRQKCVRSAVLRSMYCIKLCCCYLKTEFLLTVTSIPVSLQIENENCYSNSSNELDFFFK